MLCECEECRVGKYNQKDFLANLEELSNTRKVGVSGYMRLYNDAPTLEMCVESVISTLDELCVVIQECSDDSLQIIKKLQKKYPNKIFIFEYLPPIYFRNTSIDVDETSVHSIVNYNNFILTKCSYKYAIKIDADQIYITEKLQIITNAYSGKRYNYLNFLNICHLAEAISFYKLNILIKKNKNNKYFFTFLSGLNLITDFKNIYVSLYLYPLPEKKWEIYPFNGSDHYIFNINRDLYYIKDKWWNTANEFLTSTTNSLYNINGLGLCFLHTGFMKYNRSPINPYYRKQENIIKIMDRVILANKFLSSTWSKLIKKYNFLYLQNPELKIGYYYNFKAIEKMFNQDKKLLKPILKKIKPNLYENIK